MHRVAPQCSAAPLYLVAKPVKDASAADLDPRGAYIIQQGDSIIIWKVRRLQDVNIVMNTEGPGLPRASSIPAPVCTSRLTVHVLSTGYASVHQTSSKHVVQLATHARALRLAVHISGPKSYE